MSRALVALALVMVAVYAAWHMGAGGWFTLTFALVLVAATILFLWPALLAGAIAYVLLRAAMLRARRGPRRWGR